MALTGANIAFGYVNSAASNSLFGGGVWSQTMATGGTTAQAATATAPTNIPNGSYPAFEFYASVDAYVATGPAPDATVVTGGRVFVPAGTVRNLFCVAGDKLSWIAVP